MELTLQLTPDQEARLQAEAHRNGLPLPEYALRRLLDGRTRDANWDSSAPRSAARESAGADEIQAHPQTRPTGRQPRRRSALGKFADVPTSSEAFADRKAKEKSLEDRDNGRAG